jgi:hypothetical protein
LKNPHTETREGFFIGVVQSALSGVSVRFYSFVIALIMAFICVVMLAIPANAQSTRDYVKIAPPPSWAKIQDVPLGDTQLKPEGSTFYRLVDWQQRISTSRNDRYRHNAIELKTADAVQDNSNFKISFDPSYQNVQLHHLNLIRSGKRLDRLKLSDFETYRIETDRDKLLYNGRLQTGIIIPDVQVGDILDYSYTVSGRNTALGPHYRTATTLGYGVPIQRQHERILIHENLSVNVKTHNSPPNPTESVDRNYRIYEWLQDDVEALDIEDTRPAWHYAQPRYDFSSFETWDDVGEYFAPKYQFNYKRGGPIVDIATEIKAKSDKVKTRTRLALAYIHDNIRYTGIEIGSGGYIPRPPEQTLENKFGDCKDMTVLLLAILKELEIEAYPILVDTDYRGGIDNMIPSHGAFDHVLVHAKVAGEVYLLDGTRGSQLGDLDRMEQSSYGKGLLLQPGKARMVDLGVKQPAFYKDVVDTFDMFAAPDHVTLKSVSNYYGYEADSMNDLLVNSGREKIEENFLSFFQNTYPDIEQVDELEIAAYPDKGRFTVEANYKLQGWTEDTEAEVKTFLAYPSDMSSDVPDFKGGTRTMPYSISHPRKSRHRIVLKLNDTWDLSDDNVEIDNVAFKVRKKSTFKNSTYTQTYIYHSKQDHIPAEIFSAEMEKIKSLEDELGVELTVGTDWLSGVSESALTTGFILWYALAAILAFIVAIIRINSDADWMSEQIFYPVKLSKFLLLSIVSMGLYTYFWAYKNWRWIRDIGRDHNTPILRSWFMVFTNFALLPQLAEDNDGNKGYGWYGPALGGLLGLGYFIAEICGRIADRMETAPLWVSGLGLVSFVFLIPAVKQINRLNIGHEAALQKNSTYHWTTIGFIIIFVPIFLLVMIGMFS